MTITRNNYEAYFIDYMEGRLNSFHKKEFIEFLESNPDIEEELQSWEEVKINPDTNIQFSEKNNLKKTNSIFPKEPPFEELCIAKIEGDLTEKESSLFDQKIKEEPGKAETYNIYNKVKFTPDESIIFPEKEKLKAQNNKLIKINNINYQHILAVAAGIALIVGLFFGNSIDKSINNDKYANLEKFKKDISIFVSINKTKNKSQHTNKNIKHINHSITINNNLLPISKVEYNNLLTSSNNSISKIKPTYFSELKTVNENNYTTKMHLEPIQNTLFTDRINKSNELPTRKGHNKNAIKNSNIREQPNRFLLNIADLGFKGVSKLTGKEIDLERSYSEKGELKRLAFKTETFSISTKINE